MKTFLTCFALFVMGNLSAQSFSIQGRILDDQSDTPLEGAHISLMHPWGEIYKTVLSGSDGRFALKGLSKGGYRLRISYIGFEDFEREVTLSGENADLGIIRLKEGVQLSEVEIKGKIPMAEQRGDTTQYNASAFKTLPDASAEELVEKMPGMVIENGKVQAQGEDVKEVLVDGRPFFGNDPTAALRNLPAEVIDKIQVFDQKSDQANFSGFDDGETSKTLNIITRPNMRNGQFGKVYAGYGWDNKYQGGGNTSIFDGDRRLSFIGQLNNVNQQNF
ncbi:MAG: TonB-dependent receptor, partial [Bacteroidetes bacterium]